MQNICALIADKPYAERYNDAIQSSNDRATLEDGEVVASLLVAHSHTLHS